MRSNFPCSSECVITIGELYDQSIRPLPTADRLQLARMILNDIPPESVADYKESWSDEDLDEFSQASWQRLDPSDVVTVDFPAPRGRSDVRQ